MASSYKNPPKLNDGVPYEQWTKELKLWAICCKVDKKEQAPAVVLSLEGRAREAALELEITDLNADDGLDKLVKQLDGLFLKDEHQRMYVAYAEFEKYQRASDMSIDTYISDFERLYNRVKAHQIELPDPVLAYRVLESANLPKQQTELIRTTITKLEYKAMKTQLRKLEDVAVSASTGVNTGMTIKEEPVDTLYGYSRGRSRGARNNYRGNRGVRTNRGGARPRWKDESPRAEKEEFMNYQAPRQQESKCFICKSVKHWARNCPHRYEPRGYQEDVNLEEEVAITLFTRSGKLLSETIGCGVLDTGCTKNVCSEYWLTTYLDTLGHQERNSVTYQDSDSKFKFGDGTVNQSKTKVTIPAIVGGKLIKIETDYKIRG